MDDDWVDTPAMAAFERLCTAGAWDDAFAVGEFGVGYGVSARAISCPPEMLRASFNLAQHREEFVEHLWPGVDSVFQITPSTIEEHATLDGLAAIIDERLRGS